MTAFIRKEFRSLVPPAGLVLAAALAGAWLSSGPSRRWIPADVGLIAFLMGTPLIAALSFGNEFQHRTMILLLSEPVSRARVWLEKWLVVVTVVGVLTALELLMASAQAANELPLSFAAMFVVMVMCSAPLWTLVARSTVGGFLLTGAAIAMLELTSYAVYRMTGVRGAEAFRHTPALEAVRIAYSLGTLGLSWRVFARLQAVGAGFGGATASDAQASRWTWLQTRPGDPFGNLVRKELMLHRPTFLVAGAFAACWFVAMTLLVSWSQPSQFAEALIPFLLVTFVPLVVVLAGTISVGEDTSLGLGAWHLTLPVSTRRQWAIKLSISMSVGLVLAILVPLLATAGGRVVFRVPVEERAFHELRFMLVVAGTILVGFWASTLMRDTVKAALATGGAVLAIAVCCVLGVRLGARVPLLVPLFAELTIRFQLPPHYLQSDTTWVCIFASAVVPLVVLAAWQSLTAFRQAQLGGRAALRYAAMLFVAAFCMSAGAVGVMAGASSATAWQERELRAAVEALAFRDAPNETLRRVGPAELERVYPLSSDLRRWLANTTITIERVPGFRSTSTRRGTVEFPHDRRFVFLFFERPATQ